MEYIVTKNIPMNKRKSLDKYIGCLFKDGIGNYNIFDNIDDVRNGVNVNTYEPLNVIVVNDDTININDKAMVGGCVNVEGSPLNGAIVSLVGRTKEGDVILKNKRSECDTQNIKFLENCYKVVRKATRNDKEKLINYKITKV